MKKYNLRAVLKTCFLKKYRLRKPIIPPYGHYFAEPKARLLEVPINTFAAVSLTFILATDCVFFIKYASRISGFLVAFIALLIIIAVKLCLFLLIRRGRRIGLNSLILFIPLLIVLAIGLQFLPPGKINVDRWDTIYYWWDAFIKGVYPYSARTRFGGLANQLPFLQYFYFPAYLYIDYISLLILAFIFINIIVRRSGGKSPLFYDNYSLSVLFLSITSFAVLWDIVCRSSLFVNSSLLLLVIYYLLYNKDASFRRFIIGGVLGGLVLSTRLVTVIPLLSVAVFILAKDKFRNFAGYMTLFIVIIVTFTLTFLPLSFFPPESIKAFNPFIIQDSHMPHYLTVSFCILALAAGFFSKSRRTLIFLNGILLWLMAFTYIARQVSIIGLSQAYFGSRGDISYLVMSLPFFFFILPGDEGSKEYPDAAG